MVSPTYTWKEGGTDPGGGSGRRERERSVEWAAAAWLGARLVALSGERVGLRGLGRIRAGRPLTVALEAYGGAALLLWAAAGLTGHLTWVWPAVLTGLVYAVAFGAYAAALSQGALSSVSAWSNATAVLLFLQHPTGGWVSWLGLALFGLGGGWLWQAGRAGVRGADDRRPILWMLICDAALVAGRGIDVGHGMHSLGQALPYAATVYTTVAAAMATVRLRVGGGHGGPRSVGGHAGWLAVAAMGNALAYLALLRLLADFPPAVVEAASAGAALSAAGLGVICFGEKNGGPRLLAAGLLTLGAALLVYDHSSPLGIK